MSHFSVQQKLAQHCKSATRQLKKKGEREKRPEAIRAFILFPNSMENKYAVALKKANAKTEGNDVVLSVPALSAGVLTITKPAL